MTGLPNMRLLRALQWWIGQGVNAFQDEDTPRFNEGRRAAIQGNKFSMIFQDPAISFNPALTTR